MKTVKRDLLQVLVLVLLVFFLCGARTDQARFHEVNQFRFFVGRQMVDGFIKMIDRADESVTLGMYYVMTPELWEVGKIFDALKRAQKRGVKIRVGLETREDNPHWNRAALRWLKDEGMKARFYEDEKIQHIKGLVIDSEILYIGSQNLSAAALRGENWESGVIFVCPPMAEKLEEYLIEQK